MGLFKKNKLIKDAREVNKVLDSIGLEQHTKAGEMFRKRIALDILGKKYEHMRRYAEQLVIDVTGEDAELKALPSPKKEGVKNND